MRQYCVVLSRPSSNHLPFFRSAGVPQRAAELRADDFNRYNQDRTWNAVTAHVEELTPELEKVPVGVDVPLKIVAVKPVWDRSARVYRADVVRNADPLYAHQGYLVYTEGYAQKVLDDIEAGKMLDGWKDAKKLVVCNFLRQELSA